MTYKLNFAPKFIEDLDEAFGYISGTLFAPSAANALMKEIDNAVTSLKTMPYMYPECPEPLDSLGYRKIIVKNFILVYEIDENAKRVNLLRCFYGKSNYIKFFE